MSDLGINIVLSLISGVDSVFVVLFSIFWGEMKVEVDKLMFRERVVFGVLGRKVSGDLFSEASHSRSGCLLKQSLSPYLHRPSR